MYDTVCNFNYVTWIEYVKLLKYTQFLELYVNKI